MKLRALSEKECLTPESVYTIEVHGDEVSVKVKLPFELTKKDDLKKLEDDIHDHMEQALKSFFVDNE